MTTNFSRSGNSPPRHNINRPLGRVRNTVQDTRPAQVPPKPDTSVLVHDCFDQHGGENKPTPCGCSQRISRLDATALIRKGRADALVMTRFGKPERKHDTIVLRRDYVAKRREKTKVSGRKLLPALLKSTSILSFKKGVIRGKNGTAIQLELDRTDAHYWNTVLVQLGLGKNAGLFLKDAAWGMGIAVSLTTLEPFQAATATSIAVSGLDPGVDEVRAEEIVKHRQGGGRRVYPTGPSANAEDINDTESNSAARLWSDINKGPKDEQKAERKLLPPQSDDNDAG
jgi:hypothetical protein